MRAAGFLIALAVTLGTARASAEASPEPATLQSTRLQSATLQPTEPRAPSPWPELAAVFPGFIVHGSGVWLQRRNTTATRLLLLEGASVGTIVLSGLLLFQTGAARDWVGPLALTSVAGVGTFGLSFAANLYATWAPADGFGEPLRALPALESSVGYLYVYDPQFDYRHFLTTSVEGRLGPVLLGFQGAHAPEQGNRRFDGVVGYRLLGLGSERVRAQVKSGSADGSYLELRVAGAEHRFDTDGFLSHVLGLELQGRLDLHHYLPDVRGAFFQLGAGYAGQWFSFDLPRVDTTTATSLLLAHVGFGIYLGNRSSGPGQPSSSGGELELYYDHRHDGFANGLKVRGLGSGPAGHLGALGSYFFTPRWGLSSRMELGSAWCWGLNLVMRAGLP